MWEMIVESTLLAHLGAVRLTKRQKNKLRTLQNRAMRRWAHAGKKVGHEVLCAQAGCGSVVHALSQARLLLRMRMARSTNENVRDVLNQRMEDYKEGDTRGIVADTHETMQAWKLTHRENDGASEQDDPTPKYAHVTKEVRVARERHEDEVIKNTLEKKTTHGKHGWHRQQLGRGRPAPHMRRGSRAQCGLKITMWARATAVDTQGSVCERCGEEDGTVHILLHCTGHQADRRAMRREAFIPDGEWSRRHTREGAERLANKLLDCSQATEKSQTNKRRDRAVKDFISKVADRRQRDGARPLTAMHPGHEERDIDGGKGEEDDNSDEDEEEYDEESEQLLQDIRKQVAQTGITEGLARRAAHIIERAEQRRTDKMTRPPPSAGAPR
jgi:hypothetical protein